MSSLEDKITRYVEEALKNNSVSLSTLPNQAIDIMSLEEEEELDINALIDALKQSASTSFSLFALANSLTGNQQCKDYAMLIKQFGDEDIFSQAARIASQQMIQPVQGMIDKRLRLAAQITSDAGRVAEKIAREHTNLTPDFAFLAGLFHYVGVFPIIAYANDHEADIQDSLTLEKIIQTLKVDISIKLLEHGNFDPILIEVAKQVSDLERDAPEADYVDVAQVASALARAKDFDSIRQLKSAQRLGMSNYSDEQFQALLAN